MSFPSLKQSLIYLMHNHERYLWSGGVALTCSSLLNSSSLHCWELCQSLLQGFWDRKNGIKYLSSKASLWHAFYLVRVVCVADICVAWLVYLTCLRSHILRAYCNFESRQEISKTLFSFRGKFFHAYWALHVNDGIEVYQIKLISIMTTDDPDIIRFRWSEIWGIKSIAWLRVTF